MLNKRNFRFSDKSFRVKQIEKIQNFSSISLKSMPDKPKKTTGTWSGNTIMDEKDLDMNLIMY